MFLRSKITCWSYGFSSVIHICNGHPAYITTMRHIELHHSSVTTWTFYLCCACKWGVFLFSLSGFVCASICTLYSTYECVCVLFVQTPNIFTLTFTLVTLIYSFYLVPCELILLTLTWLNNTSELRHLMLQNIRLKIASRHPPGGKNPHPNTICSP